ncbi:MAG: aminoglycoside phosphotransferase family protein [bacterium]|nr:aminoglycoside phosphotransferase family protein [bacterium]
MSTHKTKIEQQVVLSFLEQYFNVPISDLVFIEGGEGSQAFSFSTNNKTYVIRVNTRDDSFKHDNYAYEHFHSNKLPIPKIIEIGKLDDKYYFAISEKVGGKKIDAFSEEEQAVIKPKLLEILDIVHSTDISSTSGYGGWDNTGNGHYESWSTFLKSLKKWVEPKDTPSLFETTILEKEVWEKVYNEILKLVQYCPEERHLVHGDYGFDNVFSDGKNITGVIDWGEAKYGDFIYDCAWLSYWSKKHYYRDLLKKYFTEKSLMIFHFDERMRCYELHIGLGALSFYANSQQDTKYYWNKERLLSLL